MAEAVKVKERPILFSGQMVRAILDGRKTQTRRVVKPQPEGAEFVELSTIPRDPYTCARFYRVSGSRGDVVYEDCVAIHGCNWGKPGDRLWVRETWCLEHDGDGMPVDPQRAQYKNNFNAVVVLDENGETVYRKDGKPASPWRSPRFMPRWASRITLEVTKVQVERVRSLSRADYISEGMYPTMRNEPEALGRFRDFWNKLNAKRGYGWDVNPWVWVIDFRVFAVLDAVDHNAVPEAAEEAGR